MKIQIIVFCYYFSVKILTANRLIAIHLEQFFIPGVSSVDNQ